MIAFTLRFRDPAIHRLLRDVARARGTSMSELAEELLARELRIAAMDLERTLESALERLRSYRQQSIKPDIAGFARAEVSETDPLRADHVTSQEPSDAAAYRMAAAFANHSPTGTEGAPTD
jgi:hypothetical protein